MARQKSAPVVKVSKTAHEQFTCLFKKGKLGQKWGVRIKLLEPVDHKNGPLQALCFLDDIQRKRDTVVHRDGIKFFLDSRISRITIDFHEACGIGFLVTIPEKDLLVKVNQN